MSRTSIDQLITVAEAHGAAATDSVFAPSRRRAYRGRRFSALVMAAGAWARMRLALDLIVVFAAAGLALVADPGSSHADGWLALAFPLVVTGLMRARRGPDERLNAAILDTIAHVLGVVSLAVMMIVSVEVLVGGPHPLAFATRLWLFTSVYLATERSVLIWARRTLVMQADWATPTLVVGAGMIGAQLVGRLISNPSYGLRPVGFIDPDPLPEAHRAGNLPVLADLDSAIAETGARHVILAFSGERDHVLAGTARECVARGIGVSLVPRLYEAINERATLDHVGGLPLLTLNPVDPKGWQFAIKHALDRGVALLALTATSPLMIALAIAVRLSSPGPILFRQQRVGRDGREFTMLKFRSMQGTPNANGEADAAWAATIIAAATAQAASSTGNLPDPRITRVGRLLRATSLDELPQLINVVRGDMSLVGPRPERVAYVRDFERLVARYGDRHRVKAGMTGWAQVHGLRGQTSIADRIEWDNFYIQNWSLRLDIRILALTIAEVLRFRDGHAPPGARPDGSAA